LGVASVIASQDRHPGATRPTRVRRFAERTALLYALVSAIWIVGSDSLVALLRLSPQANSLAQTAKGWLFVAASAIFFLLALRSAASSEEAEPVRTGRQRSWMPLALLAGITLALAATGSVGFLVVRETATTLTRAAAAEASAEGVAAEIAASLDPERQLRAAHRLERAAFAVAGLTLVLLVTAAAGVALWWRGDRRALETEQRMALLESERLAAQELASTEERARRALAEVNRELEARVAARTADLGRVNGELESANQELEAFAYSVSHDLRAPLRAIDGFSRLLAEAHAAKLDAEGLRLLGVIRTGASRMGRLIEDLLAFSRTSHQPLELGVVDMAALVDRVVADLVPAAQRGRIEVVRGELPPARADLGLIRQVWQNLLSNAVKFSAGRPTARIELSARREAGRVVYQVRDNGVGFRPQDAGRLFGIFERLHSSREFEGSGVGLALVARILARHGGGVGAEGEEGVGAMFWFWLPEEETAMHPSSRADTAAPPRPQDVARGAR
jgi:signal transduction histidine kinase